MQSLFDIPAQMINEIAAEIDEPVRIARRYGMSAKKFAQVAQSTVFMRQVAEARKQLEAAGYTLQAKCDAMAEELVKRLYQQAITLEDPGQIGKAADIISEIGRRSGRIQQAVAGAGGGPQFSIKIVLGDQAKVIDASAVVAEEPPHELPPVEGGAECGAAAPALPAAPGPVPLPVPDFTP